MSDSYQHWARALVSMQHLDPVFNTHAHEQAYGYCLDAPEIMPAGALIGYLGTTQTQHVSRGWPHSITT
jgi:hypothetical protein